MTQTTEEILQQRGSRYGEFVQVANLTQALHQTLMQTYYNTHGGAGASPLPAYIIESWHMICNKLARAACGDPYYIENFKDISGYSTLVATELGKQDGATDAIVSLIKRKDGEWVDVP